MADKDKFALLFYETAQRVQDMCDAFPDLEMKDFLSREGIRAWKAYEASVRASIEEDDAIKEARKRKEEIQRRFRRDYSSAERKVLGS